MADSCSGSSFVSDRRGVSAVLGFILMFGILILALTTYQAQIVPQENAATEFEHFQDVRDEMVGIRNSISTAGQADVSQFSDLTLGTNYQTRTFTINPPPPTGTLQTSDAYNITIANESDSTNVTTRFLEYQPGYFEIDIGSIRYEHSVLYLDERDRGNGVSIIEDQNILNDSTVRITALQNRFNEGGTKRIALELYPQEDLSEGDGTFPTGPDLTITIPTRLDNETYWDDELGGKDGYQGVDIDARGEGIHAVNLSVNSDDLEVNTVGTRSEPDEEPAKNVDPVTDTSLSDPTDPISANFDTLTVSVSSGNIQQVRAAGEINNVDTNGYIQVQLFRDSARTDEFGQNGNSMESPFDFTTDTGANEKSVYVEVRLLDGDNSIIQECGSNSALEKNTQLSLSDFSC